MAGLCPCLRGALEGRPFIVYHWDADGVATAALMARRLEGKPAGFEVPSIGRYSWQAVPRPSPGADRVLVLDYGIPGSDYEKLAEALGSLPLYVLDHHRVEPPTRGPSCYCNPVAERRAGEEEYPAASLLAYRVLGEPRDDGDRLLAALGVAGDLAPFLDAGRSHPGLAFAEEISPVPIQQLRRLAEAIDSCYRLLDRRCLRYAAEQAARDPFRLLSDPRFEENRRRASRLLEEAIEKLQRLPSLCGAETYLLEMDALVTSAVGRRLASKHPSGVVALIHHIPSQGGGFIYVRSLSRRLDWLHEQARRMGLRAGGKTNVAVIEYEGSPSEAESILRRLCGGQAVATR
jgi:hypothetical protein